MVDMRHTVVRGGRVLDGSDFDGALADILIEGDTIRALGMADRIGRLAPGYLADLVFLDLGGVSYMPLHHPARQVLFRENGANIESVMVGGRFVYRGGRHLTVDLERLRAEAAEAHERHEAANRESRDLVRRLEPAVSAFCVGLCRESFPVHRYADHGVF